MKLQSSEVRQITPEVAKSYLERNYKSQRPVRPHHVQFLAAEMTKGSFTTNSIVFAENGNGEGVMVNGQHTLEAILLSETSQVLPVMNYYVDGSDELASLYATIDVGLKRNDSDTLRAFDTSHITGLGAASLNKLVSAVKYFYAGWPRSSVKARISPIKTHEICLEWAKEYKEIMGITNKAHQTVYSRMHVQGTLSVLLALIKHSNSKETVLDFVEGVALDDGLRRGDPRKALNFYLVTTLYRHSLNPAHSRMGSPIALATATAWAWNKFQSGQSLNAISAKVTTGKRRVPIKTTDFYIDAGKTRGQSISHDMYYHLTGTKPEDE